MAVHFSGTGQSYTNSSGLPATALFTITCWVRLIAVNVTSGPVIWMMSSGSSQYAYLGYPQNSSQLIFDWSGGASTNTNGPVNTLGTWFKSAVVVNGTSATLYANSSPTSALTAYPGGANFTLPTGTLAFTIGPGSAFSPNWSNADIAALKMWDAALTQAECEAELQTYTPQRTANLNRWHPLVRLETTDYSGNSRTLSGGAGATQSAGPPISWTRLNVQTIPWDPNTPTWYALYDTTTGQLLSTGQGDPGSIPAGTAFITLLGAPPDESVFEWSTTAHAYVRRVAPVTVDRVDDLLNDATLTSAWAALSGPQSTAMQARIGQMLGPYRYRLDFQDVDLIDAGGSG